MCGIVGAIAERNIVPVLVEGLRRLEYRGYDSAGVAVVSANHELGLRRTVGKVAQLEEQARGAAAVGQARRRAHALGDARRRDRSERASALSRATASPSFTTASSRTTSRSRTSSIAKGYEFKSETDTEVAAHLVHDHLKQGHDLLEAVRLAVQRFVGAYALLVFDAQDPERIVVSAHREPARDRLGDRRELRRERRAGAPARDAAVHLPRARRPRRDHARRRAHLRRARPARHARRARDAVEPRRRPRRARTGTSCSRKSSSSRARSPTRLYGRVVEQARRARVARAARGRAAAEGAEQVHIVACGTSYHAGSVGRYWLESLAGMPCQVEIASEYRYRNVVVPPNTLFVTLSQSGETADTLEALRMAKTAGYLGSLTICNSPHSSMVRESDLVMMTQAGPEIGVASTKAFTTQLLVAAARDADARPPARHDGRSARPSSCRISITRRPPSSRRSAMNDLMRLLAEDFAEKHHALFLGRGPMWPIAMEGALKLKEISYIHAEAYAAGELKHGPLALIDEEMPVIVVAPNNDLLDKLKSNMQVVRARGGQLYVFADRETGLESEPGVKVISMPHADRVIAPIVYTVPLQLLAYHAAVLKGTDIDQPRNLAKSVTVE